MSSLSSTPGRWHSKCWATDGWAASLLWYSWSEDHFIISSCIRYWVVSIRTHDWPSTRRSMRSINVTARPWRSATGDSIVGGNWKWSPASKALGAYVSASQQAASVAWKPKKNWKKNWKKTKNFSELLDIRSFRTYVRIQNHFNSLFKSSTMCQNNHTRWIRKAEESAFNEIYEIQLISVRYCKTYNNDDDTLIMPTKTIN